MMRYMGWVVCDEVCGLWWGVWSVMKCVVCDEVCGLWWSVWSVMRCVVSAIVYRIWMVYGCDLNTSCTVHHILQRIQQWQAAVWLAAAHWQIGATRCNGLLLTEILQLMKVRSQLLIVPCHSCYISVCFVIYKYLKLHRFILVIQKGRLSWFGERTRLAEMKNRETTHLKNLGKWISHWSGKSQGNCGLPVVWYCSCNSH